MEILKENTTIQQNAHKEMMRAEKRLKGEVKALTKAKDSLQASLTKMTRLHTEASEERDALSQQEQHLKKRIMEVCSTCMHRQARGTNFSQLLVFHTACNDAVTERIGH